MNAAPVMEVFHTSFLIPLMSNEIENFSFSAGRLSFIFRCKEKISPHHSAVMVWKDPVQSKAETFIPEKGGFVLWVCNHTSVGAGRMQDVVLMKQEVKTIILSGC